MSAERRKMSRARILTGATEILNAGVYGDLTVDALARALHMSKSTLYKYFASKEDVIVALIDEACVASEEDLAEHSGGGSASDQVAALVEVIARHADRLPRAAVLQQRRLPAASQDRIELTTATLARAFRDAVSRGVSSGAFSFAQPALVATTFMSASRAAMEAAARGEVGSSRSAAVKDVWALVSPGLKSAKSATR